MEYQTGQWSTAIPINGTGVIDGNLGTWQSGYHCRGCGGWVPFNTLHQCSAWPTTYTPPQVWDDNIVKELRAIRELLENLVQQRKYQ